MNVELTELQKAIRARGLTQQKVADRIGVNAAHLCGVLKGRHRMTRRMAHGIAAATGIPFAVVMAGQDETKMMKGW